MLIRRRYGMKVNDGSGLFDNEGMCDKGILIANDAVKDLTIGNYIAFCNKISQIAKIFANLKDGIRADRESMEQKIEDQKKIISLLEEKTGVPVEKDGAE